MSSDCFTDSKILVLAMAANSSDQEGVRRELEASVANIHKLLHHWRTWDAEYEGLRETLSGMKESVSLRRLVSGICLKYHGSTDLIFRMMRRLTAKGSF